MPMCMFLLVEDPHKMTLFDTSFRGTTLKEFISKTKSEGGLEEQIANKATIIPKGQNQHWLVYKVREVPRT